ncbi:hypothetical protein [Paenimyroides ceti]
MLSIEKEPERKHIDDDLNFKGQIIKFELNDLIEEMDLSILKSKLITIADKNLSTEYKKDNPEKIIEYSEALFQWIILNQK